MPTIRDVAQRAGVAPITVSRVINNAGYVTQEKRERVEAAIADLKYVPNTLARSFRLKQTHTIALVLTDVTNPFWTEVARGVEDAAREQNFNVILCNTDESASRQAEYLSVLLQKQVDGILLVPANSTIAPIELIQAQGTALVVLDRHVPAARVDVVRCDSEGGAHQLTEHMLSLGHRRIAVLTGPADVSSAQDRVAGYRRALAEAGVECVEELIFYGGFVQTSGYQMAQQALLATPRPTALFAANNFIAIGAWRALREAGLRVPDDMTLVAFDDLPASLMIEPFFTVAAQPGYEMGKQGTDLLLTRLAEETPVQPQEIVFPTRLIVRSSSGPPRNSR
jgi:LacI family transcriptional regulator